jgi:ankyrin repeat protein
MKKMLIVLLFYSYGQAMEHIDQKEINNIFMHAVTSYDSTLEDLENAIAQGPDKEALDFALSLSASKPQSDSERLRLLIQAGADVNNKTFDGQMPLIVAAEAGNSEALKTLLGVKASVNSKDGQGLTALSAALQSYKNSENKIEIIKALVASGAKVTQQDIDTVQDMPGAVKYKQRKEIEQLLIGKRDQQAARIGLHLDQRNTLPVPPEITQEIFNWVAKKVPRAPK